MGLFSTLGTAASGLRTAQAGIDLVSQNVANAGSAGYTRRVLQPVQALSGDRTTGVRTGEIQRTLDAVAQKQLWLEKAGASYTGLSASYAAQLDALFGQPGGEGALDTAVNAFGQAAGALAADPASATARAALLGQGGALAARIAALAEGVQALRTDAETRIGAAVGKANDLLAGIAALNGRIVAAGGGTAPAGLLDERDRLIDSLSGLLDIRASTGANGAVRLATTSGQTLVDGPFAAELGFDGRGTLDPGAAYSPDPARRGVGTVTVAGPGGGRIDLVAAGAIRSGEIAAALQARDVTLVQAQRQLDELAGGLSRALSDRPAPVTETGAAGAKSFAVDMTGWQPGNAITVDYTSNGAARRLLLVPSDAAAPAIAASDTSDPGAVVIRFDRNAAPAAMEAALQAGLAAAGVNLTLAVTGPARFAIADDGAAGTTDVTGVAAGITVTGLAEGVPALPFFVDQATGRPFTGSFEGGSQLTGLSRRLALNPDLAANPSRLVVYATAPATPQGDATRPRHIAEALDTAQRSFASAGLNGVEAPVRTSVADFARQVVAARGEAAEAAERLDTGQQVALAAVQDRFSATAGISVDEEMARLLELQTAYGANARVMTAARDMLDLLMRM